MVPYRLAGGRIVQVDASAAKGARVIDFTLEDGRVVDAVLVPEISDGDLDEIEMQLDATVPFYVSGLIVEIRALRASNALLRRSLAMLTKELEDGRDE